MNQFTAPFSALQVDALNHYQIGVTSVLPGHPFTCPHRSDGITYEDGLSDELHATHGSEGGDRGLLIASTSGWICPHCGYTQDWAHAFMADVRPSNEYSRRVTSMLASSKIDVQDLLSHKIDTAIEEYLKLYFSRCSSVNQTSNENQKSKCIWDNTSVMIASLRRLRASLFGVTIAPGSPPTLVGLDSSWTDLNTYKPIDGLPVLVLMQDQPEFVGERRIPLGGVSNPGHPGYGCNVWTEVRTFDGGTFLSTGGNPTHWKAVAEVSEVHMNIHDILQSSAVPVGPTTPEEARAIVAQLRKSSKASIGINVEALKDNAIAALPSMADQLENRKT